MPRVTHFEIHTEEPERAINFYSTLFGWTFSKWEGPFPYWLVTTGPEGTPGINGGLLQRPTPLNGDSITAYVCTIDVDNIDNYLSKAQSLGASVALPKMPIPNVGWLAYCKDTEANIFGMMQPDAAAK